jgi:hypothetical protein
MEGEREHDVHSVEEVLLTFCSTGDIELLEAITPHSQVLPSRRRSKRKTPKGLHERFPRGKFLLLFPPLYPTKLTPFLGSQLIASSLFIALYISQ